MKNRKLHLCSALFCIIYLLMALASVPAHKTYRSKPVNYPCVRHAAITYSPILLRINIDANYTPKDLSAMRQSIPSMILGSLNSINTSYRLADGVRPNLVLTVTFTNDGYDHYGVNLYVDWQGQGNFTIRLPSTYVTAPKLIDDMTRELNTWVTQGWHEGNCN